MVKKQTIGEVTVHNTQRIMCNKAAVGYTRKEFRFHNMDVEQRISPQDATAAMDVATEMQTIFKVFDKPRVLKSDKPQTMKDFNNAAMFQVSEVDIDPNSDDAASSYMMSIKIWDTEVIKEQWFYEDFTNQNPNGGPIITSQPQKINLELQNIYADQYAMFVMQSPKKSLP